MFAAVVILALAGFSFAFINVPVTFIRRPSHLVAAKDGAKEKETMGKAELVDLLRNKTGFTKPGIEALLGAFIDVISEEVLQNGKELRLRDFGTFKVKTTAARVGRNPRTGEELQISPSRSVSFSVSSSLKQKLSDQNK